jgi:pyruvate dehydrogenase E1 component
LLTYDAAYGYEIAVIIQDGLRRLYAENEEYFYYLTLYNESYPMPAMPEGAEEGILKGMYKVKPATKGKKYKAHIFGSGPILRDALRAQDILAEQFDVAADVWSVTSYKLLRGDALRAKRWNMLHPTAPPKQSYLESLLQHEEGVFVAVSDYMKMVADQIAPWVPGGLMTLGTDGFGRSDTRENLRRFFEVDAESTTVATLYALHLKEAFPATVVDQAIKKLGIDPEKSFPFCL